MGITVGRPAPAHKSHVIESHFKRALNRQRAAEAHAAKHGELLPPLQQQPDDFQEILVPADRDAILGNAAESRHHPIVERLINLVNVADRFESCAVAQHIHARRLFRQRLDLQAVNANHGMAVVHQVVRQREARRSKPNHQNFVTAGRKRYRPREIQRIPARQQTVNLEAPRQLQNIFQRARFDLRNIDGVLLLKNAGLHAIVADAMPGAGRHRIVDGDDRQRAHAVAALLDDVHLGNLFVQRTARQRDSENGLLEFARLLFQARRATVFALVVALDAVVRLIQRAAEIHASVSEFESLTIAPTILRQAQFYEPVLDDFLHRNQMEWIEFVRNFEENVRMVFANPGRRERGPSGVTGGGLNPGGMLRFVFKPL